MTRRATIKQVALEPWLNSFEQIMKIGGQGDCAANNIHQHQRHPQHPYHVHSPAHQNVNQQTGKNNNNRVAASNGAHVKS